MQFDWVTFALEIVNFLVLVWILKRFLYQPVLQTIARRKAAIDRTLADAKSKQSSAEALETQYRDRLADWEKEKQALRGAASEEVDAERARRMTALTAALDQEREKQRVVEARARHELQTRLEEQAAAQGVAFAARLLARLAAPELEAQLVAIALEDLAGFTEARLQALRHACRDGENTLEVTTAFPLREDARQRLLQAFSKAAETDLSGRFSEDPGLLAGLRASIGPWVMHANLQDELKLFSEAGRHGP